MLMEQMDLTSAERLLLSMLESHQTVSLFYPTLATCTGNPVRIRERCEVLRHGAGY